MPDSRVISAEIDHNNDIVLSVKVNAFYTGEYVEISGYATQNSLATTSGAGFATFSEIQEIDPPKGSGPVVLKVKAKPTNAFQKDLDVTVAVRVSKVWVTVLSAVAGSYAARPTVPAPVNTIWASVTGVGGPDDYSSAQGSDGQTAAGAPANPTAAGTPPSPPTAAAPPNAPTA